MSAAAPERSNEDGVADRMPQGSEPTGWDRRDTGRLAALVLVLVATRIAWVVVAPDSTLYWEEDYRWSVAREIAARPVQPFVDYQADDYQGGSLVLVGLVMGSFALLGESLLALKAVAMVFSAGILIGLYGLGRCFFDRRVALLAGLAYVTGPPLLAWSGLVVMGSHGESTLVSVVQLGVFLAMLSGRVRSPVAWAAFGLVSGIGIWFCYTSGLGLVACGITWLVLEGVPRPRALAAAAVGAFVGLTPWIAYNAATDWSGVARVLEIFGAGDPIDAWQPHSRWQKAIDLLRRDLPYGLFAPFYTGYTGLDTGVATSRPRIVVAVVVAAGTLPLLVGLGAAIGRAVRTVRGRSSKPTSDVASVDRARGRSELVFVVYALLFVAVYLASDFTVEPEKGAHAYRLFLPLATLLLIPVAITASNAWRAGGASRRWTLLACAAFCAASVVGGYGLVVRDPRSDLGADVTAHVDRGYLVRGVLVHRKHEPAVGLAYEEARRVSDPALRGRVFEGIGWGLQFRFEADGRLDAFEESLDALSPAERAAVLVGVRFRTSERLRELSGEVVLGTASARDLEVVRRLRRLLRALEAARREGARGASGLRPSPGDAGPTRA